MNGKKYYFNNVCTFGGHCKNKIEEVNMQNDKCIACKGRGRRKEKKTKGGRVCPSCGGTGKPRQK